MVGFECTVAVADVDAVAAAVVANGGTILIPKVLIPHGGAPNLLPRPGRHRGGAMHYDSKAVDEV